MIMDKKNLTQSPVLFDEGRHTYQLDGQQLDGVTPIIAWLFPDTYKDIPQSVLDAAADYGTMIHKTCELYDSLGIGESEITKGYAELLSQNGLKPMLSEYLVSDEHRIASSIDKVMENYDLADIKATSKVHIPNVTMQLSIYAWLFERQNPGITAGELYCIWLPRPRYGKPAVFHLQRVPSSICEQIVDLYYQHAQPIQAIALLTAIGFEFKAEEKAAPVTDDAQAMMNELVLVKKQIEQLEQREKELKGCLFELMRQRCLDKWGNDDIQLTIKEAYERETVDSKRLKNEYPEAYGECKKVTKVAESITIKLL